MIYWLNYFEGWYSPLRMFQYITFRTVAGAGTAFVISLLAGPWLIALLKRRNIGQYVRQEEAPPLYELHNKKAGTPTMGGLLILLSVTVSALIWARPGNLPVLFTLASMWYMGVVGFWDDYLKLHRRQSKGLAARSKMLLQLAWALVLVITLDQFPETQIWLRRLMVPFIKDPVIENIGWPAAFLFVTVIMLGATNAVNLTDGLDGLAIGCSSSVALTYLVLAYAAGHAVFAEYLYIPYVAGSGELAVFCGCLAGAGLGFLWYNCHPARVFMGDTGSLALGGAIATVAILIKQELVLIIAGGVFVIEALSVIIQVGSFKLRRKRVFRCAPIHHHFEMMNWSETQVTVRFWILSIVFSLMGLLTLKIR